MNINGPRALAILFLAIPVLHADITLENVPTSLLTMSSSTDEQGMFSYTFSEGTNTEAYAFLNPSIHIEASHVTSIESPIGWETTREDGHITWAWAGAEPFLVDDTPFTFTVHCSEPSSMIKEGGILFGDIHTYGSSEPENIVGYNRFSYLKAVPEPTTSTLFMAGALGTLFLKRHQDRFRKSHWKYSRNAPGYRGYFSPSLHVRVL